MKHWQPYARSCHETEVLSLRLWKLHLELIQNTCSRYCFRVYFMHSNLPANNINCICTPWECDVYADFQRSQCIYTYQDLSQQDILEQYIFWGETITGFMLCKASKCTSALLRFCKRHFSVLLYAVFFTLLRAHGWQSHDRSLKALLYLELLKYCIKACV